MGRSGLASTPKSVNIALTGKCNLRCKYCFYADEMEALKDLPTEAWLTFFRQLTEMGVMDVTLSGGEVLTRPDLFVLIDGVIQNRLRYCLLTNGTLVDEEVVGQFDVGKRRLRLNYIQVSIDGSTAEVHDASRPKSFDRAIRGLRLLKGAGLPVTVRVTINRHNLDDLENLARLLLEDVGVSSIGTNDAMPVGAGCHAADDVALTSGEKARAMETMGRLARRYPGRLTASAGPQAKLRMYAEMELAARTGELAHGWSMGNLSACGCVYSMIDVLHDGSIVPCAMLPDLVMGKIQTDSLAEIWREHPTMQAMRARRSIPMKEVEGCQQCEWSSYCNGSCPGLAHQLTGELNRANPEDCYRRFLMEVESPHATRLPVLR